MGSASSSTKQIQIEFTPLILASGSISVSNDSFALSILPGEVLIKIGGFASVGVMRNLTATCKYIRNQLGTWFLRVLASENNPDRATSGFIVDVIGNEDNTCLWRNAKFLLEGHAIPKDFSIHLFANTTAEKISSDEVRSMIIQVSGLSNLSNLSNSLDPHHDICKFLKFLFSKVSFKNLKCLMFCGIEHSTDFSQEIGTLKLDVFHARNFSRCIGFAGNSFFYYFNSLKTLYVVHPEKTQGVAPPKELKKLVIYCPKSSKHMIDQGKVPYSAIYVYAGECHALKEM